jgi:hypothetical protein
MSFSWQNTLSTLSMEGASKVSRSATAATTFSLALEKVGCGGDSPSPGFGEVDCYGMLYLERRLAMV